MTEKNAGVNPQASNAAAEMPTAENKQDVQGNQPVQNNTSDVVSRNVYENVRESMKAERTGRRSAEAERDALQARVDELEAANTGKAPAEQDHNAATTAQAAAQSTQQSFDTTADQYIQQASHDAAIARKYQEDPSFKQRADIVISLAEDTGVSLEEADRHVKSRMMDELLKGEQVPAEAQPVKPQTINPTATQENVAPQQSGDKIQDFLNNPNVPDTVKNAIRNSNRY